MSKTKWYTRPVYLLVALALVLSLGVVAVPMASEVEANGLTCSCGDICVNTTGWWHDGGTFNASATPIQDAVSNATSGETICVKDGNYTENVDVNTANLTIQSENGTANCVVNTTNSSDHIFEVTTTNWVNITGFTLENATAYLKAGIFLANAAHCNISSNKVTNNDVGIFLIFSCKNNTLTNNTASNNSAGIALAGSYNNTLTNNTANSNDVYAGIYLDSSSNNTLRDNTCSNNTVGIRLSSSSNNTVYNNYFHNTNNAWDNGTNTWNTTKTLGTNIIGGPYLGGNYWSDYAGSDTSGDGLGDTSYNITGDSNKDYLPLVPVFNCTCGDICVNETGWWHDGGGFNACDKPIQDAVSNATSGETICVKDGNYTENVDVNTAHLTIQSENGTANCVVNASDASNHVVSVHNDYVNITGFTVENATVSNMAGIILGNADHCNISSNKVTNNDVGIFLFVSCNNNTLSNNTASNNSAGIVLAGSCNNNTLSNNTANSNDVYAGIVLYSSSSNNTLRDNTCSNNTVGIWLEDSSNNNLTNNTMSGNSYNFKIDGTSLSHYTQNIDTSNTVDEKPIYYWVNHQDEQVPDDAGFVGVVNSTNITVKDSTLTKNGDGVLFAYTDNSRIENVTTENNIHGTYLDSSSNNTLTNNNVWNNTCDGICLSSSSTGNEAHYNSIVGNTEYGVNNTATETFNATLNWWGNASGPSYSPGTKDKVSSNVTYSPWLMEEDGTDTTATNTTAINGNSTINSTATVGGNVTIAATGKHNITTAKYAENPGGAPNFQSSGNYYDVHLDNATGVTSLTVQFCPASAGALIYYWDESSSNWRRASNQSYSDGCIVVTITSSTEPTLSDLTGKKFGDGNPFPTGGEAYPVNKLAILAPWIALGMAIIAGASVLMLRRRRT